MGRWQPSQTAWCWHSDPEEGGRERRPREPAGRGREKASVRTHSLKHGSTVSRTSGLVVAGQSERSHLWGGGGELSETLVAQALVGFQAFYSPELAGLLQAAGPPQRHRQTGGGECLANPPSTFDSVPSPPPPPRRPQRSPVQTGRGLNKTFHNVALFDFVLCCALSHWDPFSLGLAEGSLGRRQKSQRAYPKEVGSRFSHPRNQQPLPCPSAGDWAQRCQTIC